MWLFAKLVGLAARQLTHRSSAPTSNLSEVRRGVGCLREVVVVSGGGGRAGRYGVVGRDIKVERVEHTSSTKNENV